MVTPEKRKWSHIHFIKVPPRVIRFAPDQEEIDTNCRLAGEAVAGVRRDLRISKSPVPSCASHQACSSSSALALSFSKSLHSSSVMRFLRPSSSTGNNKIRHNETWGRESGRFSTPLLFADRHLASAGTQINEGTQPKE